jgi:hypothetical protein
MAGGRVPALDEPRGRSGGSVPIRPRGRCGDRTAGGGTPNVATLEQCMTALEGFVRELASHDAARGLDRTVSCRLTDLHHVVQGRLATGTVHDMASVPDGPTVPKADIRLTMSSDDLLDLTAGSLSFAPAWASGRIKLEAGIRDMLRLRSLL